MELSAILEKLKDIPQHEFAYHLGLYKTQTEGHFAIVKLSGSVFKSIDDVVEDLAALQALGLNPIVTFGWGSELTDLLESEGITTVFHNGNRITDNMVIQYANRVATGNLRKLGEALYTQGAKFVYDHPNVSPYYGIVEVMPDDEMGQVGGTHNGKVTGIKSKKLLDYAKDGIIPIVSPLGSYRGDLFNVNATTVAAAIANAVNAYKFLLVTGTKGILDLDGNVISEIVLKRDYGRLVPAVVSGGAKKNLDELHDYLKLRINGIDYSGQITGPDNLLKELFTFKGSGTFVRLGYTVTAKPIQETNQEVTRSIIEDAFGETLQHDYFQRAKHANSSVLMETGNKGVAIVQDTAFGKYLDIFAVKNKFQRSGVGSDMLYQLGNGESQEPIFLRTKEGRKSYPFYDRNFPGREKVEINGKNYWVFWKGNTKDINAMIAYARERPINFLAS